MLVSWLPSGDAGVTPLFCHHYSNTLEKVKAIFHSFFTSRR